jgi:hypothetical protein
MLRHRTSTISWLLLGAVCVLPFAALAQDGKQPAPATPPAQEPAPQAAPSEQSADDIADRVTSLVRKYEAEQRPTTAADPERAALAHQIVDASRIRERLAALPDAVSEGDTAETNSRLSPKLRSALKAALLATFKPEPMMAAIEHKLAESLDADTLQVGLKWERSDVARRISELEIQANAAANRAAKREFISEFRKKSGAPSDARARACGQADVLANNTDAVAPVLEAFVTAGVMMAAGMQTRPLDMDMIGRLVITLRPMLREGARQVVLANCVYDLRELGDAEFERRLEFLRSESGGRYARGTNAALRDVLLQRTEIFARALLDVARELKPTPQA